MRLAQLRRLFPLNTNKKNEMILNEDSINFEYGVIAHWQNILKKHSFYSLLLETEN